MARKKRMRKPSPQLPGYAIDMVRLKGLTNLTDPEIAKRLGCRREHVCHLRRGTKRPSWLMKYRIEQAVSHPRKFKLQTQPQ